MIIGSIFDGIWILTSLVPVMKIKHDLDAKNGLHPEPFYFSDAFVYFIVLFTSVLGGLGESIQWVAQGKYISDCATEKTKGFFFGYFWIFFMASQIFGSVLAALVFKYFSLSTFYVTMTVFSLISGVIFYFLKDPIRPLLADGEASSTGLGEESEAPTYAELTREVVKRDMKLTLQLTVDKRMLFLAPEILWSGMSLAIFTGLLVLTISESVKGNENDKMMKSMLAMVSLGFGEIVGSLSIGQVIDRAGNKLTSVITLILIIVQTVFTLSFVSSGTYGSLVFIMMFVWGLQDSVVNTHISEILGFEFEDNTRPFSVFNIIQSVGIFTYLTSEAYVKS